MTFRYQKLSFAVRLWTVLAKNGRQESIGVSKSPLDKNHKITAISGTVLIKNVLTLTLYPINSSTSAAASLQPFCTKST